MPIDQCTLLSPKVISVGERVFLKFGVVHSKPLLGCGLMNELLDQAQAKDP